MKASRFVIKAADYRQSFAFYHDILGLKLQSSWQRKDSWGALFAAGAVTIEIIWFPSGEEFQDCSFTLPRKKVSVDFEVHDIDILYSRLSASEIEIINEPHDTSWGVRMFSILDPDGIVISFVQPKGGQ